MNPDRVAATAAEMLTSDFLVWVETSPRTYAEAMAAWRTSCPRFPIWEDALAAGLIRIEEQTGTPIARTGISLTARGRAALNRVLPETDQPSIAGP